jgi:hypothetical protein
MIHAASPAGPTPLSGSSPGVGRLSFSLVGGRGAPSRPDGYGTGLRRILTRTRIATSAAVALCLAGLVAGRSGKNPVGAPSATTPPAATPTATATGSSTTKPPAQSSTLAGTVLFLHSSLQADAGIYALRNGQISPWHPDSSRAFLQSAVVSPQGSRIAYIASGNGDEGPLRVISGTGTSADLGPQTLENYDLPVWAPDGGSVLAVYNASPDEQHPRQDSWVRINVTTGAMTPVNTPNGMLAVAISPDLSYAYGPDMASATTNLVAQLDGTEQTPAVLPAGKWLQVLSLSPDGHHVIGMLVDVGAPQGQPSRNIDANAIVDIRTGTVQPPPLGDGLWSGYYLADGSAVLLVYTGGGTQAAVVLVSPTARSSARSRSRPASCGK